MGSHVNITPGTGRALRTLRAIGGHSLIIGIACFSTAPLVAQDLPQGDPAIQFDCVVEPSQTLNLGSAVAGLIDEVVADRGQSVRKGDIVAKLRSEAEEAQLQQARTRAESDAQILAQQSALTLAQAQQVRVEALRARNVATEAQEQEAMAQLVTAQMNLKLAELQAELDTMSLREAEVALELRAIRSPIDGIVIDRNRGPGEYVFQDTHVLTVAQIDPLYVRAWLPVEILDRMPEGTRVNVIVDLPERKSITATVTVVDKVLDAATGTFGIRAEIPNPDRKIPAGQTCALSLDVS